MKRIIIDGSGDSFGINAEMAAAESALMRLRKWISENDRDSASIENLMPWEILRYLNTRYGCAVPEKSNVVSAVNQFIAAGIAWKANRSATEALTTLAEQA